MALKPGPQDPTAPPTADYLVQLCLVNQKDTFDPGKQQWIEWVLEPLE